LLGHEIVVGNPLPGQIVVLSNADGTDPSGASPIARLSLEGHRVGELAAAFFLAGVDDPNSAPIPDLPFVIHPPVMA
jgi:hypothetical protein